MVHSAWRNLSIKSNYSFLVIQETEMRTQFIICLALTALITSCGSKTELGPKSISTSVSEKNAKQLAEVEPIKASQKYLLIGEILLQSGAIKFADEMFDKASELDGNNSRARFLSAISKSTLSLEGFSERFKNLLPYKLNTKISKTAGSIRNKVHSQAWELITQLPKGELKVNDYRDVQKYINKRVLPAYKVAAEKLRVLEGEHFTLNLNLFDLGLKPESRPTCKKVKQFWECEGNIENMYITRASRGIEVDGSDIKLLKGTYMTVVNSLKLATGYNLKGLKTVLSDLLKSSPNTDKNIVEAIKKQKNLLELEAENELPSLAANSEVVLQDLLDFSTLQDEVCRNDRTNNLFTSICINTDQRQMIENSIEALVAPSLITLGKDSSGKVVNVMFDLNQLISSPHHDLKALLPNEFDGLGNSVSAPDATFNGIFPDGDILKKLRSIK